MGSCVSALENEKEPSEKSPVQTEDLTRNVVLPVTMSTSTGSVTTSPTVDVRSGSQGIGISSTSPSTVNRLRPLNGSFKSRVKSPSVTGQDRGRVTSRSPSSLDGSVMVRTLESYDELVRRDRLNEEKELYESKHNHIIRSVQIHLDPEMDFKVTFLTRDNKFVICVVIDNILDLNYRECQAISQTLKVASRGSSMTIEEFKSKSDSLGTCGSVNTKAKDGKFFTVLRPPKGIQPPKPIQGVVSGRCDTIAHTGFMLRENDAIIHFRTVSNKNFSFWHQLPTYTTYLFMLDCFCLGRLFTIAEPGDPMDEIKFKHHAFELRKDYNLVSYHCGDDGRHILRLTPTRVNNMNPVDAVLENAHRQYKELLESKARSSHGDNENAYLGLRLNRLLKESGQAAVWEGRDTTDEKVAVKIFKNSSNDDSEWKAELRILLKLPRHPNVIEVLDFHPDPRRCIVTPFLDGGDLFDFIKKSGGPLSLRTIHKMSVGILRGIDHLHKNRVIHRDLKSPNVMVGDDNEPVIIDLGVGSVNDVIQTRISRATTTQCVTLTRRTNAARGTPLWMPPEMHSTKEFSEKTDIFSFGIILWEMISGEIPYVDKFKDGTVEVLFEFVRNGGRPTIKESWDRGYVSMIRACWAHDPAARPTAPELLSWLNEVDSQGSIPEQSPQRHRGWRLRGISPPYVDWNQFAHVYEDEVQNETGLTEVFNSMSVQVNGRDVIPYDSFINYWRSTHSGTSSHESKSDQSSIFNEELKTVIVSRPRELPEIEAQVLNSLNTLSRSYITDA
uniref:Protein kinase domain-containing protein n=1 Tax=Compsopogon caeruleus TaxID=31354 RepID=A0A7S1XDV3_9RHOD|mmetsp:Transcript_15793/g.31729  ORF Transcript_15793/g.31729 Transcript_15793/m.31729 type:complete len:783 (+) Transcript_15793:100-2448(+)